MRCVKIAEHELGLTMMDFAGIVLANDETGCEPLCAKWIMDPYAFTRTPREAARGARRGQEGGFPMDAHAGVYVLHYDMSGCDRKYGNKNHYVGRSSNVHKRLSQHKYGQGSKVTRKMYAKGATFVATITDFPNTAHAEA